MQEKEYIYIHSSKRHYQSSYKSIPNRFVFMPNGISKIENEKDLDKILFNRKKTNCTVEIIVIRMLHMKDKLKNIIKHLNSFGKLISNLYKRT